MEFCVYDPVLLNVSISFKACQNIEDHSENREAEDYNAGSWLLKIWLLTHLFNSLAANNG